MNNELINKAIAKFKNAKRIAVENFTMGYDSMSMEAYMNLEMDAASYKWNSHTIQAIQYVLNNKRKMAVK